MPVAPAWSQWLFRGAFSWGEAHVSLGAKTPQEGAAGTGLQQVSRVHRLVNDQTLLNRFEIMIGWHFRTKGNCANSDCGSDAEGRCIHCEE